MRLRNTAPELRPGEGQLDAFNSGSEYLPRFDDIERKYSLLRQAELVPLYKKHTADVDTGTFADMLSNNKYEVIIAQQIDSIHELHRLAGVAIGKRKEIGENATRMTVKELVVLPDLRKRHIASYLLGRLTQILSPTEIVIATNKFVPEPWFVEGLESAGFRHTSSKGLPSMWLPGKSWGGQINRKHEAAVKNFERDMLDGWNGYSEFYDASDVNPQIRVYRDGTLGGIVRTIQDSRRLDEELGDYVEDFTISDAGDVQLASLQAVTEKEAMIALLNNYDVVPKED